MDKINQIKQQLREIDNLGGKIDEGIIDLVAILNSLGFPTRASCEGHVDHKFDCSPFVSIAPICESTPKNKQDLKDQLKGNHKYLPLIFDLLDEYYQENSDIVHSLRLTCVRDTNCIEFITRDYSKHIKDMQKREMLHKAYAEEINKFTQFLLKKYKEGYQVNV